MQLSKPAQDSSKTTCLVCPHACTLGEGMTGICGVRTEESGTIRSENYGLATNIALDPIEKKPLARFHPGSYILSYGSFGCNLRCSFCQNFEIATATVQNPVSTHFISPESFVDKALSLKDDGNIGIAFTYNEPFVGVEYMLDSSKLAQERGLVTVAVTNGYVCKDVWEAMLPLIDAYNIDLKCYSEEGYRSLGAPKGLDVVKGSIESAFASGAHIEVTTLITTDLFDDPKEFEEACKWLGSVGHGIPLHISRFFPCYKEMDKAPTDLQLMAHFQDIALTYLDTVYLGNV